MPFNKPLQAWIALAACVALAACSTTTAPTASAPPTVVAKAESATAPTLAQETTRPSSAAISPATAQAYEAGKRALQAGRTQEAQRVFQALRQSNPELGGPHANLGLIYAKSMFNASEGH